MSRVQRNIERYTRPYLDRFKPRRKLALPIAPVRLAVKRNQQLDLLDTLAADGASFVPEPRLPPWKRQRAFEEVRKGEVLPKVNFAGFKVRIANPSGGAHPGFPTHFQ